LSFLVLLPIIREKGFKDSGIQGVYRLFSFETTRNPIIKLCNIPKDYN